MQINNVKKLKLVLLLPVLLFLLVIAGGGQAMAQGGGNIKPTPELVLPPELRDAPPPPSKTDLQQQQGGNIITNSSFEFGGFYGVPQLGFEAYNSGHVPNDWGWFKSDTFGKYTIDGNQTLGLVCLDDLEQNPVGKVSLSIHMQSTDQADARLGIYQTVNVTPGQSYLFSIIGVIQAQKGATSPDINNRFLLLFDHSGGQDWKATPHENWTILPWDEQMLEFNLSGPNDPDVAVMQDYSTVVKAKSDKMTIFIAAWRRWANWRTSIFTVDCISLIPINQVDIETTVPNLTRFSTTSVDDALEASTTAIQPIPTPVTITTTPTVEPTATITTTVDTAPTVEPTATITTTVDTAPAVEPTATITTTVDTAPVVEPPATITTTVDTLASDITAPIAEPVIPIIIPISGGILENNGNWILLGFASIVFIVGLVSAGIWNIRQQK